jgi:hypothetical protein
MTMNKTMQSKRWMIGLVLVAVLAVVPLGIALAGVDALPRSVVASGGMVSQSGLTLHSAVGQPATGAVYSSLSLCSGFLCGPGAPGLSGDTHHLYLPVLTRN